MAVTIVARCAASAALAERRTSRATSAADRRWSELSGLSTAGSGTLSASIARVSAATDLPAAACPRANAAANALLPAFRLAISARSAAVEPVEAADVRAELGGAPVDLGEQLGGGDDEVLVHRLALAPERRHRLLRDERVRARAADRSVARECALVARHRHEDGDRERDDQHGASDTRRAARGRRKSASMYAPYGWINRRNAPKLEAYRTCRRVAAACVRRRGRAARRRSLRRARPAPRGRSRRGSGRSGARAPRGARAAAR